MARINKIRIAGGLLVLIAIFLSGCSSFQARRAYEKAERYSAEENYDAAFEKYFEAAELAPTSKKYKLELLASRTEAAASHIKRARTLAQNGKLEEALAQYKQALNYDPGIDVAEQERNDLRDLLDAQLLAEEGADFYAKRNVILARKAITKALKLDPLNARALAIKDLLERDLKKITMDGIELDVASEEPITLSFKDANIKEVFGILSELSGINFIFDEEIRSQSITVLLEKASFAQAMELIMQMNGLEKKILNSKTMIIYPQSREKEKQYEDQLIQTFYLSHIDAKKAVNLLRTMLQLRKVYVHEERNALVVRDRPQVIRLAEQILNAADRETSEVIIDLELVSVSSDSGLDFGPKLSAYTGSVGVSKDGENIVDDTLGEVVGNTIQSLNGLQTFYTLPSASFDLAKTLSDSEILASPKIRVRNNEKAKVHIGTREPVITVTQNGDNFSDSVQYVDVGVKLDVEPTIQLDKSINTKLKLEVSEKIGEDTTNRGTKVLTIRTTNAETVLTLKDGVQTIIGGLFEQSDNSSRRTVPILGDIPLLGRLFTNFSNGNTKREILLSITPHIIRNVEVPEIDVATIWSGGEDNLKDGPNFGSFARPLTNDIEATKPLAAPAVKPTVIKESKGLENISESAVKVSRQNVSTNEIEEPKTEVKPSPSEKKEPEELAAVVAEMPLKMAVPKAEQEQIPEPVEAPASANESVATEIIQVPQEAGVPIVLPLPEKEPAAVGFAGPQQVDEDKEFAVSVQVKGVENLYSAPLFVNYDPATLDLVAINEGDFLKQGGQSTVFSSSPNRTTGRIIVGYKQGAGGNGASGTGTLFDLVFKPLATGETRLEVDRINFRNPEGRRLEVVSEAVKIEIR